MSTDSQGRPLSDDGQWAWSGTEWVPASGGGATPGSPASEQSSAPEDVGATMIAPSPFAGGTPTAGAQPPYGAAPQPPAGGTPGYAGSTPGYGAAAQPAYGAAGAAPGYGASSTPPKKSRGPLVAIILVLAAVIIAAVVVVLIFTLGGDDKKAPAGAFTCTTPGQTGSATVTFLSGDKYALSDNGKGGTFTQDGDKFTFKGGSLNGVKGTFDSGAKTVKFTFQSLPLTCKQS